MKKLSDRGENAPSGLLTKRAWERVERRLLWAYRGEVQARHRRRKNLGDGIIRARRLLAGRAVYRVGGERLAPEVGEWVFSPEGAFEHTFSDDAVVESVAFRAAWPTGERFFAQEDFVAVRSKALDAAAGALIAAGAGESRSAAEWAEADEAFARWMRAYVNAMLEAGARPRLREIANARVRAAMAETERWPAGTWPSSGEVAERAGLSRGQLNRLFVREAGQSLEGFLKVRRLARARAWLAEGLSAKETGAACGFATPQSFSKWFGRAGGESPREFMRRGPG